MMKTKVVEVQDIIYEVDSHRILDSVTLEVYKGEILFIIGPNGAGKTTLLKIILGLLKQNKGDVRIFGKENSPEIISSHCGYISQYTDIDRSFPISVSEVVDLHTDPPDERKKIRRALEQVQSLPLIGKKISELSGGEFQKVLIARALANSPDILFLDEPTNNLDVPSQLSLFTLLGKIKKKLGMTLIIVSHDINVVSDIADRVICLNKRIGCRGTPSKVLTKKILESVYGRSLGFYGHT